MRLWTIHPKYLDPQGLVALWREALLARAVLRGQTRGYRHHPQLERFRTHESPRYAINAYLAAIHSEAAARGYAFDKQKIGPLRPVHSISTTAGQISYEWQHLLRKLSMRSRWCGGNGAHRDAVVPSAVYAGTGIDRAMGAHRSWSPEAMAMKLAIAPLTPDRWSDLEAVFRAKGCSIARGCWCMAYRRSGAEEPLDLGMTRSQWNRAGLKALVDAGNPPGLIGYRGKVPVGWVSIGPREEYAKLKRSPVMKAVDGQSVWSVICFVVPTEYRGQGVAQALLKGAVAYAKKQGAKLVEGYPVDRPARSSNESMWFGSKSMYDKAGFKEVARRKPQRPIVRIKWVESPWRGHPKTERIKKR